MLCLLLCVWLYVRVSFSVYYLFFIGKTNTMFSCYSCWNNCSILFDVTRRVLTQDQQHHQQHHCYVVDMYISILQHGHCLDIQRVHRVVEQINWIKNNGISKHLRKWFALYNTIVDASRLSDVFCFFFFLFVFFIEKWWDQCLYVVEMLASLSWMISLE